MVNRLLIHADTRMQYRLVVLSVALFATLAAAPLPGAWAAEKGVAANAGMFLGHADPSYQPGQAAQGGAAIGAPGAVPTVAAGVLGDSLAADAIKPSVPIYASPEASKPLRSLQNPTREGVKLILGVLEQNGEWLKVILPVRPNGTTGWVRTSDVKVRTVSTHIVVDVSDFKLWVFKGQQMQMEVPVGVGKSQSPTPLGRFYVDISVPFKPVTGAYGAHLLSVAGFSEVLTNFGGGVGQIAIHGTTNLATVGVSSSNGCLRLANKDVVKLKDIAPPGTPVLVQA